MSGPGLPQDFTSMMDVTPQKFIPPSFVPNTHLIQQLQTPGSGPSEAPGLTRVSSQEINICKMGQETVQDIVNRTTDIFQALKVLQPPNGTIAGSNFAVEKKARIQEQLRNVTTLFRRLRVLYDKCCELTKSLDMEYTVPESLIPMAEDWDGKVEERYQSEGYRIAVAERASLQEQLKRLNQELKCALDLERAAIYRINTMCAMVKS